MARHTFAHKPYSFPFGFFATTHLVLAIFFMFGIPAAWNVARDENPAALLLLAGCVYGLYYIAQLSFLAPFFDQLTGKKEVTGVVKSKSLLQTQRFGILEQFVVRPLETSMGQPTARYWFKLEPNSRPYRVSQEMYHALAEGQTITATHTGFSRIVTRLEIEGALPPQPKSYQEKEQLQTDETFRSAFLKPVKLIAIIWLVCMLIGFLVTAFVMLGFLLNL